MNRLTFVFSCCLLACGANRVLPTAPDGGEEPCVRLVMRTTAYSIDADASVAAALNNTCEQPFYSLLRDMYGDPKVVLISNRTADGHGLIERKDENGTWSHVVLPRSFEPTVLFTVEPQTSYDLLSLPLPATDWAGTQVPGMYRYRIRLFGSEDFAPGTEQIVSAEFEVKP